MTLLDLAKKYPTMRKILLRQRGRDLQKEIERNHNSPAVCAPLFTLSLDRPVYSNLTICNSLTEYTRKFKYMGGHSNVQ